MKKIALLVASATLMTASIAHATDSISAFPNPNQALVQTKMKLLGAAQNKMQLEIQAHIKRSQTIQALQICIQAAPKAEDFKACDAAFEATNKSLDEEEAALRKMVK